MPLSEKGGVPARPGGGSSSDPPDADAAQPAPAEGEAAAAEPAAGATSERELEPTEATPTLARPGSSAPPRATAAGRVWVALTVGVVLIVLLIIFIAENSDNVTVSFLGAHGRISLGLAMLGAAVVGALVTLLVGTTRILQLRREVRRNVRRHNARHT
jgi:uncharacterized integral membrane protein